jgi:enolase
MMESTIWISKIRRTKDKSQIISTEALTEFYKEIIKEFPIVSIIEDPFNKDHWEPWTNFIASIDIQVYLSLITFFKYNIILSF